VPARHTRTRRARCCAHALARTHLVDLLRAISAPGRLTLIAAGAGWGKTTLVASWIRALDAPVTLVVDDYHLADSAEIHIGVGFLATHLPATLRLVLVSRTEPPLPLARLRGQGRVAEIGTEDLRLSAAESAELLEVEGAVTGTTWTPDDAARLHTHTEGWVIGVHLGVLSRRGHPDAPSPGPSPVPSGAGGGPTRHLVDYLRRDVLDPLREVLRRTAALHVFRGDLADAVTGGPDAAALLAQAEREQLFVSSRWTTTVAGTGSITSSPRCCATTWRPPSPTSCRCCMHGPHGGGPRTTSRWRRSGTRWRATNRSWPPRWWPGMRIGQVETALGWFRALGDDACRADPRLAVARALTGAHTGRPHEIVSWTAVAERVLDAPSGGLRLAPAEVTAARIEIAMMRWTSAIFDGDAPASRQHLDEILRLLPDGAATSSGFVVLAQGVSKFRAGELDAA
jgi:hypothetical protein